MNDDNLPEDDMQHGDNVLKNEKALGAEAHSAIKAAEKLFDKHDRIIQQIHPAIVRVGEKLMVGRELYEFDNNGFNDWIVKNKLDQGRVFGGTRGQQQRTAAMTIYRLVVHGEDTGEEGAIPQKLDLTNCKRARPDDIIEWARKDQPHLFAELRNRMLRAKNLKGKTKPAAEKDEDEFEPDGEIGDLGAGGIGDDPLIEDLKAEIARLHAENAELKAELAALRERLGERSEQVLR